MIVALALVLLATPADILTVAADGSAQFTTIQAAIDAAEAGDVLLVAPGDYGPIVLTKDLSILGPAVGHKPAVEGFSLVGAMQTFTLAGLEFANLSVSSVPGRGVIDDCRINRWSDLGSGAALDVYACNDLLVSRCVISGSAPAGSHGTRVEFSRAAFVNCRITGGPGYDADVGQGGAGGAGALVENFSHASFDDCELKGGRCGYGYEFFNPDDGIAGDGLDVNDATVAVRGSPVNYVLAGDTADNGAPGYDVLVGDGGKLVIGGVDFDPASSGVNGSGLLLEPNSPEPFLALAGVGSTGAPNRLLVSGPAGQMAFVMASLQSGLPSLAKLESPLWLVPLGLPVLAISTTGIQSPVSMALDVPQDPQLLGLVVFAQAVFPGVASTLAPGKEVVTDPVDITPRW